MSAPKSQPRRLESIRVPPHSIDAEQAVLGGLMLNEQAITQISDWLSEKDFYRKDHRLIYRAICELSDQGKPYDAVTLGEWFEANALSDAIDLGAGSGVSYIIKLANSTPSAANIAAYAEIVREKSRLRELIDAGTEIASEAFQQHGADSSHIASKAANKIATLIGDPRGGGLEHIKGATQSWMKKIQARYERGDQLSGLSTPFGQINDMTQGLQPGDTIIIAGRPSMGKTVLFENLARHNAMAGNATAIFSLEMSKEAIVQRGVSAMTGVPHEHLRRAWSVTEEEWKDIIDATGRINKAPLWIDDQAALTADEIVARARRMHLKQRLTLVGIDHLGRLALPNKDNETKEVGDAMKKLQAAGKKYGWVLAILVQLNRALMARASPRPIMSDLRASGKIEEDADIIWFLHRDEYYNPETHLKGVVEVITAKGRDFDNRRTIHLQNQYQCMRLADWVGDLPEKPEDAKPARRGKGLRAGAQGQAHMPYNED